MRGSRCAYARLTRAGSGNSCGNSCGSSSSSSSVQQHSPARCRQPIDANTGTLGRHQVKVKASVPEPLGFCVFGCTRHACSRLQWQTSPYEDLTGCNTAQPLYLGVQSSFECSSLAPVTLPLTE
jgi:hypothetical protein